MEKILRIISSIKFKTIILTIISIIFIISFYISITEFKSNDPQTKLNPILSKEGRELTTVTVNIETGLLIKNFPYFSIIENKFIVDVLLWFKFDPDEISLSTIEKFSFENGKISDKSSPDIRNIGNKVLAKYNVIIEINGNLDYHKFPIEDHSLSIILINNFVTPNEVIFNVLHTDFVISPDIFIPNWKVRNLNTSFGIDEDPLNQLDKTKTTAHPKAIFIMNLEKDGFRKAFIIFLPIFLVFFFALLSLFLSIQSTAGRARLAASSVAALLTYRFIIEGMMPKVGYFTTADLVYGVLLTCAFITLFINIIITKVFNDANPSIEDIDEITKLRRSKKLEKIIGQLNIVRDSTFVIISITSTIFISYFILI